MLDFIPIWIWGIVLALGIVGFFFKNRFSDMLGRLGSPLGLKVSTTLMVLSILAFIGGGWGVITGFTGGMNLGVATIEDQAPEVLGSVTGEVRGIVSDGVTNGTGVLVTTEDYINDEKDVVTIYSADKNNDDTNEYRFNITIERQYISEDANVRVTCSAPDKELSGVTEKNAIEKTGGEIDLTYVGGSSTGTHEDGTTVYTNVAFAEGDGSQVVEISGDNEESYHDGMSDLDDYFDIICTIQGDGYSDINTARIFANS